MSLVKALVTEMEFSGTEEEYLNKEKLKAHKHLEAFGFGRTSYNKDKSGKWTHSTYTHSDYPHDVTLSRATDHEGKPHLLSTYTKRETSQHHSSVDLLSHLQNKKTFPKSHWWNK